MVVKLFGSPMSTYTRTTALVLHEKKIPFEFVLVDMEANEHNSPAFLEKQPFGQVPYIDDDGFILHESRAIARYLDEKYPDQGTKLIPTELKAKALFEQASSVEQNNFSPLVSAAVFEKLIKERYFGLPFDEKVFQEKIDTLSGRLDVYDKILAKQKYLAGDEFTLADLCHIAPGSMLSVAGSDVIATKPNVARWFNEIASRPAWQAILKDGLKSTA